MIKDLCIEQVYRVKKIKQRKMLIWGVKEKSKKSAEWLLANTEYELDGFVDNNKDYSGKEIEILDKDKRITKRFCYFPNEINLDDYIVFCGMHLPTCLSVIKSFNKDNIFPIETGIYESVWDKIEIVADKFLVDDESRNSYYAVLYYRMTGNYSYMRNYRKDNPYFCFSQFKSGAYSLDNDVFVDCGAYCGETFEKYIENNQGIFKKIYAFEPGDKQYKAMNCRKSRLINEWALENEQIELIQAGVGEDTYDAFIGNGLSESMSAMRIDKMQGGDLCSVVSLDSYVKNEKVTAIKMDIEGYEKKAIKGAQNIIKDCSPRMTICIYHGVLDMIEIPYMIKNICEEYKMRFAIHSSDDTDGVLYCYANERVGGNYPGLFE